MRFLGLFLFLTLLVSCASGNRPAQLVGGAGPTYPPEARAQGLEGSVTVIYDIEADGRVSNLSIVRSDPEGVFDEAALATIASWRFNPKIIDGVPVASRRKHSTVSFRLDGAEAYDQY